MAETLPHDKRVVFDYLTLILDLSTVTRSMALLSLEVWRETNSRMSQERKAVLLLHDIYFLCVEMNGVSNDSWKTLLSGLGDCN